MKQHKISLSVAAAITLIAMAVTFSVTMILSMNKFNSNVSSVQSKERMYNKLAEVDRYVRANEYFQINDDTLNDTIASGYMLGISDKYARYYSAKQYAERQSVESGKLMGIGVAVVKDASSGYARITRVYENSPATEFKNLQQGGFITGIDGVSVKTMADTAAITSALLGEDGTNVTVDYLAADGQSYSDTITHTSYTVPTVRYQVLNESCGYIKIESFGSNTAVEFKAALGDLGSQNVTSYLIDLRDNTGENIPVALTAADYCVPAGAMNSVEGNLDPTEWVRNSDDACISQPMAVLVNGSTAEGAELFAACLRQMGGATLVGSTTAGKGVILSEPQGLSDGSAVAITVGLCMDSTGANWNNTGYVPDVDATLSADEQRNYFDFTIDTDPQIQKGLTVLATA